MGVTTITRNDRIAGLQGMLHAGNHRFLSDIKVAKAANQAHAVHLARLFLESADRQHFPVIGL